MYCQPLHAASMPRGSLHSRSQESPHLLPGWPGRTLLPSSVTVGQRKPPARATGRAVSHAAQSAVAESLQLAPLLVALAVPRHHGEGLPHHASTELCYCIGTWRAYHAQLGNSGFISVTVWTHFLSLEETLIAYSIVPLGAQQIGISISRKTLLHWRKDMQEKDVATGERDSLQQTAKGAINRHRHRLNEGEQQFESARVSFPRWRAGRRMGEWRMS